MRVIPTHLRALLYLWLISGLWPTFAEAEWQRQPFQTMGTQAYVEFWTDDNSQGPLLIRAVQNEFERINQLMSPYLESSELSLLNRDASQQAVTISAEFYQLLQQAEQLAELSAGAFDISFASVGFSYDYRQHVKPSVEDLAAQRSLINYRHIQLLANNQVRFAKAGVKIDLGGIAKGYAVERSIALLAQAGIQHALVTAGGDTRLLGDKRGRPWLVAIKHPRKSDDIVAQLPLINSAISTSGDYERFFIEDGVRYHHILDPKSGTSPSGLMSVTVLGPDTTRTDALSTTLFVLGLERGMALIEQQADYEAIFISSEHQLYFSSGLAR
ncbi:FAD:protein FMN transferase [Alishewanella sp. SMS8]|uniref:FAD:protein FMN transferase n=1 Tax=Alishewanella sp. SMS8 TaxID=2994676 RepID=UPI0027422D05|nr:FAD:protein FMN transferase [Alishewanella sp. SMS8]MDP4946632.1 FAD:protein FMN transferase [Alishewanella sp.]MDP5035025.1 FAD:protein FMN transferase [Alishewanella sp.]MDP5458548.1 FAD:protein FMN transferase [Alishewanella sp. SMS8]